jgi:outer membrane biosynthesis protein TonB
MARKAKQAKPTQQEQPKEQPKQQEQPKELQQPKQQPTKKPKPVVKRITMEYFQKFNASNNRKSWVKETIERAANEPVMVKNLTRGQIMALINQVNRHNMISEQKIAYKYDVRQGIVLLAPKQRQGEQL